MNLELLFWAARNGGERRLYDMACEHADTTMKYQFAKIIHAIMLPYMTRLPDIL